MTDALNLPALLEANARYLALPPPTFDTPRPRRHLAVVACMDARIDLFAALGLAVGDAHLLRNAGGRVTPDVVRSLAVSSAALGTREFGVVHHTGCGLHRTTNDALAERVRDATGSDAGGLDFLPFDDLDGSVRDDVEALLRCRLLPSDSVVWGAVFDVASGALRVVVPPAAVGG